ncbi:hypothetical protein ScPMuIL_018059 [Solemya velum]
MDRKPDVDELLRALGKWGRYQLLQTVLVGMDAIPCAFHLLSVVFIGYRPPYRCKDLLNFTALSGNVINVSGIYDTNYLHLDYQKCSIDVYYNRTGNTTALGSVSCLNGYEYNTFEELSFVTEWDLVCDNEELAELTQTLIILGQGIGAATLTTFADKYGRKPVHIISHFFIFAFGLGVAFSPSFYVLAPLRFMTGVAQQGVVLTTTILNLERFPMEARGYMHPLGEIGWTTGGMLIPLISYILRNVSWRYIQIVLSVWSAYSLVQYWIIDESLRWLVANGKTKEIIKVVKKACRWNNVDYNSLLEDCNLTEDFVVKIPNETFSDPIDNATMDYPKSTNGIFDSEKEKSQVGTPDNQRTQETGKDIVVKKYNILDILKTKSLFLISLILWYAWIVDSLSYYGLFIISSELAGDRFLNFFLSALVELPAIFVLLALINRIGRKRTSITFHAITGIALLIGTALLTTANGNVAALTAATAFSLIGKFGASGSFNAEFCYTPELYPTNLRNAGIGVSSALSRIGGMVSPFARTLAGYILWGPGLIFGLMCLFVTVLMTRLPETHGHELPESIEELKEWYNSKSKSKNKRNTTKEINIELRDASTSKNFK